MCTYAWACAREEQCWRLDVFFMTICLGVWDWISHRTSCLLIITRPEILPDLRLYLCTTHCHSQGHFVLFLFWKLRIWTKVLKFIHCLWWLSQLANLLWLVNFSLCNMIFLWVLLWTCTWYRSWWYKWGSNRTLEDVKLIVYDAML